jgi:hypothetical protein
MERYSCVLAVEVSTVRLDKVSNVTCTRLKHVSHHYTDTFHLHALNLFPKRLFNASWHIHSDKEVITSQCFTTHVFDKTYSLRVMALSTTSVPPANILSAI